MLNLPMMPNSVPNVISNSMPTANPTAPKPTKRTMKMEILIYSNEKFQVVDHSQVNPQTVYYSNPKGAYAQPAPPTNIYSSSPPTNVKRSYSHYDYEAPTKGTIVPPLIMSTGPSLHIPCPRFIITTGIPHVQVNLTGHVRPHPPLRKGPHGSSVQLSQRCCKFSRYS